MINRHATAIVLLFVLVAAHSPFSAAASAQTSASCNREMARQDAALRQFDADAQREGLTFARNEIRDAGLDAMKDRLAGDPTAEALEQARQAWKQYQDFLEQGKSYVQIFADAAACFKSGASGCMNEMLAKNRESKRLLGRVSDASDEWIKSLANDTISKAVERVEKARSIMQELGTRAGNLATGAAAGAIENCFQDMEQRVEARQNQPQARSAQPQTPPQLPQPPTSPPPAAEPRSGANTGTAAGGGGGIGTGTVVGLSLAAVGGTVGAMALSEYAKKMQCSQFEAALETRLNSLLTAANNFAVCRTTTCQNSRIGAVNSAASSLLNTAGEWCTCLGPNAATELSSADKAAVRDAFNSLRSLGVNPGSMPACFR